PRRSAGVGELSEVALGGEFRGQLRRRGSREAPERVLKRFGPTLGFGQLDQRDDALSSRFAGACKRHQFGVVPRGCLAELGVEPGVEAGWLDDAPPGAGREARPRRCERQQQRQSEGAHLFDLAFLISFWSWHRHWPVDDLFLSPISQSKSSRGNRQLSRPWLPDPVLLTPPPPFPQQVSRDAAAHQRQTPQQVRPLLGERAREEEGGE